MPSTKFVYPASILSSESFGSPTAWRVIGASSISSLEAIGSPTFTSLPKQYVYPASITSSGVFGNLRFQVMPNGFQEEAFGIPAFNAIVPDGIASVETFGGIRLPVFLDGIPSYEVFGFLSFSTLQLTGILSEESFGLVSVPVVFSDSILSEEAFGSLVINPIVLVGIPSSEAFGLANIIPGTLTVPVIGITGGETFGGGLTVNIISHSINYLPEYNREQDFFKMICDMVDYVRTRDYLQWTYNDYQTLLNQVEEVIPVYHDTEAILAYYKFMINPIIGTRTVLDYITKLIGFNETEVQEWFQYAGSVWHFKVFMGMVALPIADFGVTYDAVYNLIMEYKNERSYLEELHIYIALYVDLFIGMIPLCGEDVTIYDIEIMVSNIREVDPILSSEAFGIPRFQVMPLGLLSDETIGSPALNGMVPFGVVSDETFGTIRLPVYLEGFQEEDFGSPRLPIFPPGIISREEVNIFPWIKPA